MSSDGQNPEPVEQRQDLIPIGTFFLCFVRLSLIAVGGGAVGWMFREIVERRKWVEEAKFLKLLTISQILPGANLVNLAVYVGLYKRGILGAVTAAFGVIALPMAILLSLGAIYEQFEDNMVLQRVLVGLAAVGIASMLSTVIISVRQIGRRYLLLLVTLTTFVTVGILRWPMIPVVCVVAPASVLIAWITLGRRDG